MWCYPHEFSVGYGQTRSVNRDDTRGLVSRVCELFAHDFGVIYDDLPINVYLGTYPGGREYRTVDWIRSLPIRFKWRKGLVFPEYGGEPPRETVLGILE